MAVVHRPGQAEHIGGPSAVTIKATGEDTAGSLYLGEAVAQPGFAGPPPHRHRHLHDMFYVLQGVLTVKLAEDTLELEAGSFVCIPPGTVRPDRRGTSAAVLVNHLKRDRRRPPAPWSVMGRSTHPRWRRSLVR